MCVFFPAASVREPLQLREAAPPTTLVLIRFGRTTLADDKLRETALDQDDLTCPFGTALYRRFGDGPGSGWLGVLGRVFWGTRAVVDRAPRRR
jgi:hypothetical protein